MRIPHHYVLVGQTPVVEPDVVKWAQWFETMILLPNVPSPTGIGPEFLNYQTRCSTWLEAEQQHARAIAAMREQWDDVEQIYPAPLVVS